jgi:hypothetical protein
VAPYTHNATPDILDTVVTDFVLPVHLTVCAALSSDHLPILIDTHADDPVRMYLTTPTSYEWTDLHSRPALKQASGEFRGKRREGKRQVR